MEPEIYILYPEFFKLLFKFRHYLFAKWQQLLLEKVNMVAVIKHKKDYVNSSPELGSRWKEALSCPAHGCLLYAAESTQWKEKKNEN